MKNKNYYFKGGVLLIGSLLWQDHTKKKNNTIRLNWRNNHLELSLKVAVKTPIRYGRESGTNTKIYTMTFSNFCRGKNIGKAIIVPFRQNPLTNFQQIQTEASEIAVAEGMEKTFITKNDKGVWCVLGLLLNKKRLSRTYKIELGNYWQEQLRIDSEYVDFNFKDFRLGKEKPCILQSGQLNIPWPVALNDKDQEEVDSYDFVIATVTLPTGPKYPSIKTLAKNVITDSDRRYFINNIERGIMTFQDERVIKEIEKLKKN